MRKIDAIVRFSFLIVILLVAIWGVWALLNVVTSNKIENIDQVDNTDVEQIIEKDKENETINNDTTVITKEKSSSDLNKLSEDLTEEAKQLTQTEIQRKDDIHKLVEKYLVDINEDKDILTYISPESIDKIKKETKDTYDKLTRTEQGEFLEDIKLIGYPKDDFNIKSTEDMELYINTIVKSGAKSLGKIKNATIDKVEEIESEDGNITYVEYTILYNDSDETKKIKTFLKNDKFKIDL